MSALNSIVYAENSVEAFPAIFQLSNLTGKNGFAINGLYQNDQSGWSIAGTGDFNGDGIADIIIGTCLGPFDIDTGQSFVIYGHRGKWPAAFYVEDLNGSNGFIIDDVNSDDCNFVSIAGDINDDGIADLLIGDIGANNKIGQSYVVFGCCGKEPPPPAPSPTDITFILEMALGIGGGIIVVSGISAGAYYGYHHCPRANYETIQ